ncbi:MAG: N-acetylglucosamine-6-phosphate deacetylase [Candidatus Cryptobacteroides sp.]
MDKLIIKGAKLIFEKGICEGLDLVCDKLSGKIVQICPDAQVQEGDELLDVGGAYLSAGFIDIHLHGGGGHDFMDGTVEAFIGAARIHATHGTTAMVPTTLTCTDGELLRSFEVFRQAKADNADGARLLGLHLEGPYFSPAQSGAQDPSYLKTPTPESYLPILEASQDILRWSVAPELEGALEFGDELAKRGILASIAHTDAVYEQVVEASRHGYSHFTHLYCAMSSVTRRNAFRRAGAVEAAYLLDDTTVEIIADGVHLPAPLLQFVYRFKGPDKIALCTDSMRAAGMPDGEYLLGSLEKGQTVIVEDGVAKLPDRSAFAGSVATADRLVRTMVRMAGVPLEDAVKMMTLTPARIMHLDSQMGSLEAGKNADLVIFDKDINVLYTIIAAKTIYQSNRQA